MAENFETLENILPDWANEEIEITLVEAVDKFNSRTSVTHSPIGSWATFLFLPHFDVICDL